MHHTMQDAFYVSRSSTIRNKICVIFVVINLIWTERGVDYVFILSCLANSSGSEPKYFTTQCTLNLLCFYIIQRYFPVSYFVLINQVLLFLH